MMTSPHAPNTIRLALLFSALLCSSSPAIRASDNHDDIPSSLEDLKSLQGHIQNVADACRAATVSLQGHVEGKMSSGSGVLVSKDGLILTAAHVLDALGDKPQVRLPDGRKVDAKPLGIDFDRDAAMLKILDKGSYPFVELGDTSDLIKNQWCIAMGHPGGFDPERQPPLRLGRILVNGDFVLSDCTVVGGDSGGPLFDTQGRLIGIHSSIGFTLAENRHVPISVFTTSWEKLQDGERFGKRFAEHIDTAETEAAKNVDLGEVDENGKDDLDRFLDDAMEGEDGTMKLRLTTEDIARFGSIEAIMDRLQSRKELSINPKDHAPEPTSATGSEQDQMTDTSKPAPSASGLELIELMQQARKQGGRMEMTPEMLEKMGGLSGLMKQLGSLGVVQQGDKLSGMSLPEDMKGPDVFFNSIMDTLTPITSKAAASVARVSSNGKPLTLATVVSKYGNLLAPASQLGEGPLTVTIGERSWEAQVVTRLAQYDLALLTIAADDLIPVKWTSATPPQKCGTLLTSPAPNGRPLGIGLLSVETRNMSSRGYLGVATEGSQAGAKVKMITPGSPAEQAGIEVGDVIYAIAGTAIKKSNIEKVIKAYGAGDEVEVTFRRNDNTFTKTVELAARDTSIQPERFKFMNRMSGPLSVRKSGYPEALQHDMPILPLQCGGPLLNLDGECLGINISRAGRVKTLAIPADVIEELLTHKLAQPELNS
jgi:S1-C subfamily serine protease